jgi:hypothetical protein
MVVWRITVAMTLAAGVPAGVPEIKRIVTLTYWPGVRDGSHRAEREPLRSEVGKLRVGAGSGAGAPRISSRAAGSPGESRQSAPGSPPACSATYRQGQQWGDRFNLTVNIAPGGDWIGTVNASAPQWFQRAWNANIALNNRNTVLVARPNGSGDAFGFTVIHGGNWSWPEITCRPA